MVAAPGDYIPGIDTTIKVGKIRGVESHGMMLSEREMQLSDEHDGILELPADAPVGARYVDIVPRDPVIEIAITPNRPDARRGGDRARSGGARARAVITPAVEPVRAPSEPGAGLSGAGRRARPVRCSGPADPRGAGTTVAAMAAGPVAGDRAPGRSRRWSM